MDNLLYLKHKGKTSVILSSRLQPSEIKVTNLIIVVFPTPGGPMSNKEAPSLTKSCNKLALPDIARPTRQVKPIIAPFRFLIALMRCNVRLIPARLSMAKSPTCNTRF